MKKEIKYLILLFVILFVFWLNSSLLDFNYVDREIRGPWYVSLHYTVEHSLFKYHQFPLWTPYCGGGEPFFASPPNMIFNIPTLIYLLWPNIVVAAHLETLIQMLLGAVFMYYLMLYLNIKPRFAVVASLIFIFNAFFIEEVITTGNEWVNSYIWIPLIFLFWVKSLKSEEFVRNSVLTGIFLAVQFHAGNLQIFAYTSVLLFLYYVFYIAFEEHSLAKLKKSVLVGIITLSILAGLSAIKLLPLIEFGKYTDIGMGRTFESARGSYLEIHGIKDLAKPFLLLTGKSISKGSFDYISIGIIGFILVLIALVRWRNKYVIFFGLSAVVLFLIASSSFFFYPIWKFWPGFKGQHHIGRILYLVPFCCGFLASKGMSNLFEMIEKRRLKKYLPHIIYISLIILLLFNVGYFSVKKDFNYMQLKFNIEQDLIQGNHLFQELSKEADIFRVHNIKRTTPGGSFAAVYGVPLEVQTLAGPFNVWIPEYTDEYLFGYLRYAPSKFFGMLNTKYIYSDEPLNISGFTFSKKFEDCKKCREFEGDPVEYGPYLYKNDYYLPRAYMADHGVLIIGDYDEAKKSMYVLMLDENFDPSTTAIVMQKSGSAYDSNFLSNFDVVILLKPEEYNKNPQAFNQYVSAGGILFPDLARGRQSFSQEEVEEVFKKYNNNYQNIKKLDVPFYSPNKIKISLKGEKGFLVLSEKFFMFEGWKAVINNNNKEILRADGINSAIYLNGNEGEMTLEYKPKSFKNGMLASLVTLMVIIAYFILHVHNRKVKRTKVKNE